MPLALGLVLAVVFALVMSTIGAADAVRLAVGLPLFAAFLAWAGVYALPRDGGDAPPQGPRR